MSSRKGPLTNPIQAQARSGAPRRVNVRAAATAVPVPSDDGFFNYDQRKWWQQRELQLKPCPAPPYSAFRSSAEQAGVELLHCEERDASAIQLRCAFQEPQYHPYFKLRALGGVWCQDVAERWSFEVESGVQSCLEPPQYLVFTLDLLISKSVVRSSAGDHLVVLSPDDVHSIDDLSSWLQPKVWRGCRQLPFNGTGPVTSIREPSATDDLIASPAHRQWLP